MQHHHNDRSDIYAQLRRQKAVMSSHRLWQEVHSLYAYQNVGTVPAQQRALERVVLILRSKLSVFALMVSNNPKIDLDLGTSLLKPISCTREHVRSRAQADGSMLHQA